VGNSLFRSLFAGSIREKFLLSLGRVENSPGSGLRIRLLFDLDKPSTPALFCLPWELLYYDERRDFLSRNPRTPLIRHISVPRPEPPTPTRQTLRILILQANPVGTTPLECGQEIAGLRTVLREYPHFTISLLDKPTLPALRAFLYDNSIDALHFIGHADFDRHTNQGALLFEDPDGSPHPVSGEVLAETIKSFTSLRFILLNACETSALSRQDGLDPYTSVATALLLAGMPAVVAMQLPISDAAAIAFSHILYASLARGLSLEAAVAEARLGIYLQDQSSWEWAIPTVLLGYHHNVGLWTIPPARDNGLSLSSPSEVEAASPSVAHKTVGAQGGITIGGVGHRIEGGVHLTLGGLGNVAPELRADLRKRYEKRIRDYPENGQYHFGLGLSYLDLRLYDPALRYLKAALGKGINEANLLYYIAIATLGGRRPRVLSLSQIRETESYLDAAVRLDPSRSHYFYLWALLKYDYYLTNGLCSGPPTLEELLEAMSRIELDDTEISQLRKHVPVPSDKLLQSALRRCDGS
jgi:tetratricopeptide (TPR) repeat protein